MLLDGMVAKALKIPGKFKLLRFFKGTIHLTEMSYLQRLLAWFREIGLIHWVDRLQFLIQRQIHQNANRVFKRQYPGVLLPPDYLLFEAFKLNYHSYYVGGKKSAEGLLAILKAHKNLSGVNFLDWGCGPARITRHLPELLGPESQVFGTDYNPKTIAWCTEHIPQVKFKLNGIIPPLNYPEASFDALLGISIFTHLTEENHHLWMEELHRVLKPEGVVLLTTQGPAYHHKLLPAERAQFDRAELVVRSKAKEGHRVFSAFHPPAYIQKIASPYFEILSYQAGQTQSWGIEQDYWVLQKK